MVILIFSLYRKTINHNRQRKSTAYL